MMIIQDLSAEERAELIDKVTELCGRGVLKKVDMIKILAVCREACERRIAEIDEAVKPDGPVQ